MADENNEQQIEKRSVHIANKQVFGLITAAITVLYACDRYLLLTLISRICMGDEKETSPDVRPVGPTLVGQHQPVAIYAPAGPSFSVLAAVTLICNIHDFQKLPHLLGMFSNAFLFFPFPAVAQIVVCMVPASNYSPVKEGTVNQRNFKWEHLIRVYLSSKLLPNTYKDSRPLRSIQRTNSVAQMALLHLSIALVVFVMSHDLPLAKKCCL